MRTSALLIAALLSLALLAGCGSDDELAPQVPGPPADVTIPDAGVSPSGSDAAADESGDTSDESTDSSDTQTPEATAAPEGSGDTGTAQPDASGGTTAPAPDTQADGPTNDTAPPEGSNAQQFEDFCAQNPGAC
ncbi:MAG TPA: hypothetical protein VFP78_11535 [Solirubrobacteraceae bacterium]|nr:hypothetical protein [Solirubrobacteraceae bacterium]